MKTCHQCNREMEMHVFSHKTNEVIACVCSYPECPNYALLQVALEDMPNPTPHE
jgi:hypothetical protein